MERTGKGIHDNTYAMEVNIHRCRISTGRKGGAEEAKSERQRRGALKRDVDKSISTSRRVVAEEIETASTRDPRSPSTRRAEEDTPSQHGHVTTLTRHPAETTSTQSSTRVTEQEIPAQESPRQRKVTRVMLKL